MTEATIQSEFSLENYKITEFSLSTPQNENQGVDVFFDASGIFSKSKSTFLLQFDFKASGSEDKTTVITTRMVANYRFKSPVKIQDISDLFYANSIAIVYPFLRAFVSTLTMQANGKQMLLPILNLTHLGKDLREKTKEVD